MHRMCFAVLALLGCGALQTQTVSPPSFPGGMQDPQGLLAAHQAAQVAARRPGDENLSCNQLQEQFAAAVNDPAVQDYFAAAGAAAQRDMAALEAAQGQMAGKTAATIAASVVPGASMAVMAAESAENQAKQAQAAQRVQSHALQAQQLTAIMPKIMRGQWLIELGAAKGCEFVASANFNADFQPADAPAKPVSDG